MVNPLENSSWQPDVKRIRVHQIGETIILGLNKSAERDMFHKPDFWHYMAEQSMRPLQLRPDEMVDGLFSAAQVALQPIGLGGERPPRWDDGQIKKFAAACVAGDVVPDWNTNERDAALRGVIVYDNRVELPEGEYDAGPGYKDVLASSIESYVRDNAV